MQRRNPYARLDKAAVLGALAAIGSYDPDILHAARARLAAQVRTPKLTGALAVAAGAGLTLSRLPLAGVPLMLIGIWLWWRGVKNAAMVKAGFAEFAGIPPR